MTLSQKTEKDIPSQSFVSLSLRKSLQMISTSPCLTPVMPMVQFLTLTTWETVKNGKQLSNIL